MEKYKVNEYLLDEEQSNVVYSDYKNTLVVAGAGSGKSLTIIGKIKYLIEERHIKSNEILCLSFTNDCVKSLSSKLRKYRVEVKTFHKLGLDILNSSNKEYKICPNDYLEYICHEFFFGVIFENDFLMKKVLHFFNIYIFFDIEKTYRKFICNKDNKNKIDSFIKIIITFIKLFKTNGYILNDFLNFCNKCFFKEKILILLIINIYLIYENDLNSDMKIDFDDMLIKSSKEVYRRKLKYKYIIIDEYQDTSYIRYLLIKSIIDVTNAKLLCVGDDFQSIYRFSGCDLDIFLNFKTYFFESKILFLSKTYRNSNDLINVAGSFIMKNKYQIKKKLRSDKNSKNTIKICYIKSISKIIDMTNGKVMILGRNNKDIYKYLSKNQIHNNIISYKNRDIKYYTVHRSKGLESDNVIVLNLINDTCGFPNNIKKNKILRFVSKSEIIPYDEERRLFYVALTRTKSNVYLITEKNKESVFIIELLNNYKKYIEVIK
ncbi:MAG: UvrD-helicase domain-containing protein [bacterium]|nr:UvrD-helicase domain-containing protein [bacterium]